MCTVVAGTTPGLRLMYAIRGVIGSTEEDAGKDFLRDMSTPALEEAVGKPLATLKALCRDENFVVDMTETTSQTQGRVRAEENSVSLLDELVRVAGGDEDLAKDVLNNCGGDMKTAVRFFS